jgi:hypothetical protein
VIVISQIRKLFYLEKLEPLSKDRLN